ncbi:hypothetical protein GCM10010503_40680 [Streptomyces lucensis JCM 4490]|uniref:Lipoprotein n=1 Tax=Streptomyces lucensis JCM 4490 TaxID=1306176 RepID=A0A918J865_9ACTN|nr:hypothetical protein [Streptomyces lucensis]GGW59361.1 hypothetical protein GCM10010503_40680 [Streptomyces lucensis JCM 4490]
MAVVLSVLLAGACTARSRPLLPASEQGRSDLIKAAQQVLVGRCMHRRGAAGPPLRQQVLFGTGRAELSVTLATGYTVRAHTDGCLADAHRYLYGDLARWFRAEVIVNNLRPEAQAQLHHDPDYRAALTRRAACDKGDSRCVRASGLQQMRARLEPARLARVRAAHHDDIAAYDRLRDRAVHRAADLLDGRPTPHRKGNPHS